MPGHQELFPPTKPAPYIPRGDRDQHGGRHLTPCQAAGLRAAGRHRQRQAPRPRRRSRRRHPVPPRLTTTDSWCGVTGAISCACWYIRVRVRANANAGLSPHPHPNPHPPEPDPGRARALLHFDRGALPQPAAHATARRPVQTKAPHLLWRLLATARANECAAFWRLLGGNATSPHFRPRHCYRPSTCYGHTVTLSLSLPSC